MDLSIYQHLSNADQTLAAQKIKLMPRRARRQKRANTSMMLLRATLSTFWAANWQLISIYGSEFPLEPDSLL